MVFCHLWHFFPKKKQTNQNIIKAFNPSFNTMCLCSARLVQSDIKLLHVDHGYKAIQVNLKKKKKNEQIKSTPEPIKP